MDDNNREIINQNMYTPTELRDRFLVLWLELAMFVRSYLKSYTFDLPDKDIVYARILRNAKEFGELIETYYGKVAGDRYRDYVVLQHSIRTIILEYMIVCDMERVNQLTTQMLENVNILHRTYICMII